MENILGGAQSAKCSFSPVEQAKDFVTLRPVAIGLRNVISENGIIIRPKNEEVIKESKNLEGCGV